jgi:predicted porin
MVSALVNIFAGVEVAGLEFGAAYQVYEDDILAPTADVTSYGISAAYDAKVVKVGVDYSVTEDDLDANNDASFINAAVTIPVDKVKIAAGYQMLDYDEDAQTDVDAWYLNATYKMHKKVSVFAELENTDEDDSDMGYMAGMRLKF